eukprot:COSAG02_NODE_1077_length_14724_cov_11.027145_3_plen_81_part_00
MISWEFGEPAAVRLRAVRENPLRNPPESLPETPMCFSGITTKIVGVLLGRCKKSSEVGRSVPGGRRAESRRDCANREDSM